MNTVLFYVVEFFFYSAAGWLIESLYCSIGEGRIINRGFLTGPMCPIYGTAALVMTVCLYNPFYDRPLLVFLLGMLLCNLVEYMTSFLMEKLFHARWWDYTYEFINIRGRICLKHTMYWAILSIAFVYVIHPGVDRLLHGIPEQYLVYVGFGVLAVFLVDWVNSMRKALDIRRLQDRVLGLIATVTDGFANVRASIEGTVTTMQQNHEANAEKRLDKRSELFQQIQDTLSDYELRFSAKRTEAHDKNKYSSRFLRNNFKIEEYTRRQVQKLKDLRDEIKATLFESGEMQ